MPYDQLASEGFPCLADDWYVENIRDHGQAISLTNGQAVMLSPATFRLLRSFDGQCSMGSVIAAYLESHDAGTSTELLDSLIEINMLVARGIVLLFDAPDWRPTSFQQAPDLYYPEALHVELTTRCNLQCHFCYRKSGPHEAERRMPTDMLLDILRHLVNKGLQVVEITGGEPLLHPDIVEIVTTCAGMLPLTTILTNGTLIDDAFVEAMLPLKHHLAFNISLESHRPEEHDARTSCTGSFMRTLEGLKKLTAQRFTVRVAMAVDARNWDDVEQTLLLSREAGATAFTYSAIMPYGRASDRFGLADMEFHHVASREKYLHETYKGFLHLLDADQMHRIKKPGSCGAGHRIYAMDPEGYIRPCVTFPLDTVSFGSLATMAPEEVFSNDIAKLFSEVRTPDADICGTCRHLFFCRNCILRGFTAAGSMQDEHCSWSELPEVRLLAGRLHMPGSGIPAPIPHR
ncbi:MAG: radical SAM protein [Chlorobiaceae bacterium]|nr:radical SAM protein [Chlorobiaceae bacterium]